MIHAEIGRSSRDARNPVNPVDAGTRIASLAPVIMRARFWVAAALGFALAAAVAWGGDVPGEVANSSWFVTAWEVPDGLPNNNVIGLGQTDDGHLWLAMPDTVARFDGVRFDRFGPEDFAAKPAHRVRALLRARDGSIWIGIDRDGVIRMKDGHAEAFAQDATRAIEMLIEDAEGAVWVSYGAGDPRRIKDGKVTVFTAADGVPAGPRCSFAVDTQGRLWFARGAQIGIYRDGKFETLLRTATPINRLTAASTGGVWIAAGFHLTKFDERTGLKDCGVFEPEGTGGDTSVLLEDRSGAVWLGTTTCGLVRYDGVSFEKVPVSDREVRTLLQDRDGNLWVGTAGGGLNRVDERGITIEHVGAGLGTDPLQSLCEDAGGTLWGATTRGLVARRTEDGWKPFAPDIAARVREVACVASDHEGNVWFGTTVRQLHRWHAGEVRTWGAEDGLASHTIRVLCPTRSGDLWIGEEGPTALQRLRNGKLETFKLPPSVLHVRAIVEDTSGAVWVGAEKNQLLRIVGDELTDETGQIAVTSRMIRCLYPAPDGSLWIGFGGNGVGWLRHGRFSIVRSDRGLYHDDISQIVADDRGWLWFGCDRGLFKVRQHELEDVADGRAPTVQSVYYGRDQGLPTLQASYGNWPGAIRSRDGRLWVPMRSGLAAIDPARLRNDTRPVPMLLKSVEVDDVPVAVYGGPLPVRTQIPAGRANLQTAPASLTVGPAYRRLKIDFTALDLRAPDSVQFRYRLDGFDESWSAATTDRAVIYPRLDPGNYRFHVLARNSDGVWNPSGPAIEFTVAPFVWQTWWFRLLVVTVFTLLVAAIVRYVSFRRLQAKVRVLKEQAALDKERARIARDIHDDVGGRLTRIMLLTGLALRERGDAEKASARVNEIATSARQVIKSLDETVWAINPRNDTLPDLVNYLGQFAVEFLRTADLPCRIELPDHPPRRAVSAEARHNLFLAVKEALNNIVRHAGPCEVRLRIEPDRDALRITIADDGCGFGGAPNDGCADGLRNMRQRLADIGGACHLETAPGRGTTVTFIYPWPDGAVEKPLAADGAVREA